ncbi:hypothetical protein DXG01_004777 [Tephrocybe rancida]|nr:hypothetical protein DXG01_004777 [Tephrocybe rancida]
MVTKFILHVLFLRELVNMEMSGKRIHTASSRLTDTNNVGEIILSSHRDAQNADIDARKCLEAGQEEDQAVATAARPAVPLQAPLAPEPAGDPSTSTKRKSPPIIELDSDHDPDAKTSQPHKQKKKDSGGDEAPVVTPVTMQDKSHDIDVFFDAPILHSSGKKRRQCKLCLKESGRLVL